MPNFLNHSSQAEAERALRNLQPHWNQCSKQMKRFLCFLLAPFCTSDGTPLPPCKPFCQKMKADCAHVSSLLTNLNCSKFSTLSAEHLCFGDPLTIIDCVGPHSRPCEGRGCVSHACLKLFFLNCNLANNITPYKCLWCGDFPKESR